MKVGVKYCGGCNPRYDRKKFVDRLSQEVGNDFAFEVAKEDITNDFLLVIGGCTNCCADFQNIRTKHGAFRVKGEGDYEKVVDWIGKISKCKKG